MRSPNVDWLTANQRALAQELVRVRNLLDAYGASGVLEPSQPDVERSARSSSTPTSSALDALCEAFSLTSFERDIVALCAGVELDASFGPACARAQGDAQRPYPTFGLSLAVFPGAHWSALLPEGPLRRWHLVELVPGGAPSAPVTTRPLRLDERVLHYLTGLKHLDERLAHAAIPVRLEGDIAPSHREIAARIVAAWTSTSQLVALYGADVTNAREIAAAACGACGRELYAIDERAIPSATAELDLFSRLWARETRLDGAAVLVDIDDHQSDHRLLSELLERVAGPIVVVSRDRVHVGARSTMALEVPKPTADEQRSAWCRALNEAGQSEESVDVGAIVSQFSLNLTDIRSAIAHALSEQNVPVGDALWRTCRKASRGRLEDLAQRIDSRVTFDDLVLPDAQKNVLADIVTHVRNRATVHGEWGFGASGSRGLGISALFAGASGTGKTMAAEVLANVLDLDLFRIDLSCVVSKYIGETEKNLRRIFDAAESGGVILLFDEADALFGKRSDVKDSHDRYANIEVSYLLQRMEQYRGLAILTTNLRGALDAAFLRRIRFIVQFPFPDFVQRAEIWRRVFPRQTPTVGLDVERLAQLSVAGGSIRNVALNAAFFAVDTNGPVRMAHVLRAALAEYAKLEKPLTDAEVAGWV
jgi:AAA+ superfamily predicted ATPase